jgi:hypothetical protein
MKSQKILSRLRISVSPFKRRYFPCLLKLRNEQWLISGAGRYSSLEELAVRYLFLPVVTNLIYLFKGNERLQEMMGIMAQERGGSVFATDER